MKPRVRSPLIVKKESASLSKRESVPPETSQSKRKSGGAVWPQASKEAQDLLVVNSLSRPQGLCSKVCLKTNKPVTLTCSPVRNS